MGLIDWKPAFDVTVNGSNVTSIFEERLSSLTLTDEAGVQSDTVEIALTDHLPYAKLEIPPNGAEIEVSLGYTFQRKYMGLFIADSIELGGPPDLMRISGVASVNGTTSGGKTALTEQKNRSWPEGHDRLGSGLDGRWRARPETCRFRKPRLDSAAAPRPDRRERHKSVDAGRAGSRRDRQTRRRFPRHVPARRKQDGKRAGHAAPVANSVAGQPVALSAITSRACREGRRRLARPGRRRRRRGDGRRWRSGATHETPFPDAGRGAAGRRCRV